MKSKVISLLMVMSLVFVLSCNKDETPVGNTGNVPTSPQSLSATPGNTITTLTWQAPTNGGSSAIVNYNIYRGLTSGGQTFHKTVSGSSLSFVDSNLTNGTKYYYYVTALNSAGESNRSNEVFAIPKPNPTPPTVPTNIILYPGNNKTSIAWEPPSDNGGLNILGYKIYKGTSSNNLTLLTTIDTISPRSYVDNSVVNFTTYYYAMTAFNSIGESVMTYPISATPNPYDQLSINGRITFTDSAGYYKFSDSTKGYYDVSAFAQWPPMGPSSASTKLKPRMINGLFVADYSLIVPANGFFTVTSSYIKLPYTAGSVFGLGKYKSDTTHSPAIIYDTTNARVSIINNQGVGNINFLSWVDTTKRIYRF